MAVFPETDSVDTLSVLLSITAGINGCLYRCLAEGDYPLIFATESIQTLTGYPVEDFIGNRKRSLVSLLHPHDIPHIDAVSRKALASRSRWTMDYRCQQQLRSDPLGPLCSTLDLTHLGHQVDAQHVA
ncbi:PAS domain-containing protein [Burkholderia multivorans]|uniref:PAS domain-containing protein n=1 Tax=Burkholderia multivorans TaxID=87883 RepID=UPI001C27B566|nr:PAS domain-containing protein [Burkholderia multivorans]